MQQWRIHILFYSMIVMMAALFFSRALLSVAMIVFVAIAFFHHNIKGQLRQFFASPVLWGMSLLFLLPLLSGLWSEDKKQWLDMMRIKLPLFFLPLAFAAPFSFSKKQWNRLIYFFLLLVMAGTCWSIYKYAVNTTEINEGYLKAKSLITLLENDHVRFSWLVSVAVLLCGNMYFLSKGKNKWVWLAAGTWFIIFLHLLASRTGLFSFYTCLMILTVWLMFTKTYRPYGFFLLLLLILLPLTAYFTFPTFQNRVKYFRYEAAWFKKSAYLPGANDAVRIISLKTGWQIMKENPVKGVGFGDILGTTKKSYATAYPEMLETDKIYPSGEWVMYGAGCGIPGFIIFTIAICIPFFISIKNKLLWWMLNATAAFSFAADIGLEVQFGVFIYSFIVLWWWKWQRAENI